MTGIGDLPAAPRGHVPQVRPAYRLLGGAHRSVAGLFAAVGVLDDTRREANPTTKGRMSRVELDVLRAAVVLTSAGLDASMKRLVNDAGRQLILRPATGARAQYEEFLKGELAKPNVTPTFRNAIVDMDPARRLLAHYLAERTKASFQGSGDLKSRVRKLLGIATSDVPDAQLESLNDFFQVRNNIVHAMDFKSLDSASTARVHRTPDVVAGMCAQAFDVGVVLIRGAATTFKKIEA